MNENSKINKKSHSQKKPKAYIEGIQDFYGRNFIVTPDVLIPRPETEQIIDMILSLVGKPYLPGVKPEKPKLPNNPIVLDVGTGSGCIAITIKKELPESTVYASDISKKAIRIAQKNAAKHNATIHTIISYLLENVNVKPDIIAANLPYVDKKWDWLDKTALSFEPSIALYAEENGLKLIKELIAQANQIHTRYLLLESDPCQHEAIKKYASKYDYNLIENKGYILAFELK
ncbi:HemK family protein methyltransferase [Candidatus Saccharibacteria bacterium]|nr:HemK family protein methyltransferase [Candidatus Saccharibacteria bacterium]